MIERIWDAILAHLRIELIGFGIGVLVLFLKRLLTKKTTNEGVIMEQKIIDGVETDLSLKVEDKKLKVLFSNDGKIGGAKAELYMKLEAVVDALEEAIPGDQKSIAAGLKAALGLL